MKYKKSYLPTQLRHNIYGSHDIHIKTKGYGRVRYGNLHLKELGAIKTLDENDIKANKAKIESK